MRLYTPHKSLADLIMETPDHSSKWIPVEDYAAEAGLHPSELVSMILDGALEGERQGIRWFVAQPLVVLQSVADGGLLTISACCLGSYVTAGRGELSIPLRFDDPGRPAALVAIDAAMEVRPELPVEIHLNGERYLIDSSLWVDLGAALVKFEALVDPSVGELS
jgi:hypothetical protein